MGRPSPLRVSVADQTLGGEQLTGKSAECMNAGPPRSYLVALSPGAVPPELAVGKAATCPGWRALTSPHRTGGGAWACSTDSVAATTLSSWAVLPLLLVGIVPLLVALAVAPRVEGIVPLSVGADNRLRGAKIARWVLLALTGALIVAWWLGLVLPAVPLVVAPLVMAVVLYGVEVVWSVGARLDHALDGVMLSGVHPGFRSAWPAQAPQRGKPSRTVEGVGVLGWGLVVVAEAMCAH